MFCIRCFRKNRPQKGNKFIVFGASSNKLRSKLCHGDGCAGFTPHIVSFANPLVIKNGKVEIYVSCGVCGVFFKYDNMQDNFIFRSFEALYLTKSDFNALLALWTNTGYEII
jgi:hypothetical protein